MFCISLVLITKCIFSISTRTARHENCKYVEQQSYLSLTPQYKQCQTCISVPKASLHSVPSIVLQMISYALRQWVDRLKPDLELTELLALCKGPTVTNMYSLFNTFQHLFRILASPRFVSSTCWVVERTLNCSLWQQLEQMRKPRCHHRTFK